MLDARRHITSLLNRSLVAGLFVFLLSGCASLARHDIYPLQDGKYKIAVLPIKATAQIGKLGDIVSNPPKVKNEKANIQTRLNIVSGRLDNLLIKKITLGKYYHAVPVSLPWSDAYVPSNSDIKTQDLKKEIAHLRKQQNVQAVLEVHLAGYGELKKQWIAWLIGSGVVEGVVQGVAATEVFHNETIGLAVGLEEIGQEILTWGGGAYLFNSYYSPVTIDATLYNAKNWQEIWDDTIFVSSDDDALKLYPKPERELRQVQLMVTAYKAIGELNEDLEGLAEQSQKPAQNGQQGQDAYTSP